MRDDDDSEVFLQLVDELFDVGCGNRIKRGSGFIQQQHLRLDRDGTRNAQTLLLSAGQAHAALLQLVFHFDPERRFFQRPFDTLIHVVFGQVMVELDAKRDVVINGHRERRGLLEYHAYLCAQLVKVLASVENIVAVENNGTRGGLLRVELIHAVEGAQQGGFSTAGRTDEGRDLFFGDVQMDIFKRTVFAVIKIKILDDDSRWGGSVHLPGLVNE